MDIRRAVNIALSEHTNVGVQLRQMQRSTLGKKVSEYDRNLLNVYSEKLVKAQADLTEAVTNILKAMEEVNV